jgi:hypothetical protein
MIGWSKTQMSNRITALFMVKILEMDENVTLRA